MKTDKEKQMNNPEAEPRGIKQNSPQISQIHADKFSIICAICGKRNNNKFLTHTPGQNFEEFTGLKTKIRFWIILFMVFLILSGVTAFPIETELSFFVNHSSAFPEQIQNWLGIIYNAVKETNTRFPYLSYGTDWLAFSHIVIATAFIGPFINPVKNVWVIQFGMIACIMVFPLALIAGAFRQIPFYWQLIDCSFGAFGIIPLYIIYRLTNKLEIFKK